MRQIKHSDNDEARRQVANEAAYLYAPLAHKLGLYKLKSELEDLSLKYSERDIYYHIKDKLNETKASRDKYIASFIAPIQKKLEEAGLQFHIKGRTKSIHSIYQKMRKQKCPFESVYDLFAIRVILESPLEKEKQECWQVYSIVTDMEGATKIVEHTLMLCIINAVVFGGISFIFLDQILIFFGASAHTLPYARDFMVGIEITPSQGRVVFSGKAA